MATAIIKSTISALPIIGSRDDGVISTIVNLEHNGIASSYLWEFVSKPPGSSATFSPNSSNATPTFTPDIVGSYLIRLTVDGDTAGADVRVIAVKTTYLDIRIPAAGESNEYNNNPITGVNGWHEALWNAFITIDSQFIRADGTGAPLTAVFNFNGQKATNLGAPTLSTDALRKGDITGISNLNSIVGATLDTTSDTRTPITHSLGTAFHTAITLSELDSLVSDASLVNATDVSMDYTYQRGRRIYTNLGPVSLAGVNGSIFLHDGYLRFEEGNDPSILDSYGSLYTKDVSGITELFFMDSVGTITQITDDGYLNTFNSLRGVGLWEQVSNPTPVANKAHIYAKDVSGITEMFFQDSVGTVAQITSNGSIFNSSAENGFEDPWNGVTQSFVDGTRTFTLTGGPYDIWSNGTKFTIPGNVSVQISDVEGLHFIYFDDDVLVETVTFSNDIIETYCYVAAVYWDVANAKAIRLAIERHGRVFQGVLHTYLHRSFGTQYDNGLTLGNFSIDGTGNLAANAQCSVANGAIRDEDLLHNIVDGSPQDISPIAQIPLFYRLGASGLPKRIDATGYLVTTTGTGRAAWNQFTAGAWQLTEVTNNDFVLTHILATNDSVHPIIGFVGQALYTSLAQAQAGALVEAGDLQLGVLSTLMPEFRFLGTIIFQTNNSYLNAVKSRARSTDTGENYINLLHSTIAATGFTAGDHGSLSGLGDDDHLQYMAMTRAGDIHGLSSKSALVSADEFLIEDSAAAWAKKRVATSAVIPVTTKGDIFTRDASAVARLPVGADGYMLIADSSQTLGLRWGAGGGGGGGDTPDWEWNDTDLTQFDSVVAGANATPTTSVQTLGGLNWVQFKIVVTNTANWAAMCAVLPISQTLSSANYILEAEVFQIGNFSGFWGAGLIFRFVSNAGYFLMLTTPTTRHGEWWELPNFTGVPTALYGSGTAPNVPGLDLNRGTVLKGKVNGTDSSRIWLHRVLPSPELIGYDASSPITSAGKAGLFMTGGGAGNGTTEAYFRNIKLWYV